MKQPSAAVEELDDWRVLRSFLPDGWEQKARESGALTRARGIAGADALLRVLLIHIANGCSLAETSVRAHQMGLGQLNPSAIYKRLRSAEDWLRWMADQLRSSLGIVRPKKGERVRVADATTISEPGSTGTDWRIHYAIDLATLQCEFFELTDVQGGETWRRFPVQRGEIWIGDRGYSNPNGVRHVVNAGGEVIVRLNQHSLPLFDEAEKRLDVLKIAKKLRLNQTLECVACVQGIPDDRWIKGRLLVVRRSKQATEYARKKLKQRASKKQLAVSENTLKAAQYFFVWTTLPAAWSQQQTLDLYRCRWQIELAFKRMKSIMGLGHLPKKDPESCRAWLHGKLFTSLLVERMIGSAKKLSPWGFELEGPKEQVA